MMRRLTMDVAGAAQRVSFAARCSTLTSRMSHMAPHRKFSASNHGKFSASNLLFPWLHLEAYVPVSELRERVTAFASQAAVLYALLGGVSVSGLLSADLHMKSTYEKKRTKAVSHLDALPLRAAAAVSPLHHVEQFFGHDWSQQWVLPLFSAAAFANLQGLLSSMFALAHANAMPDSGMAALIRRHPFSLHATGWLLLPSVVTLSAALVCAVDLLHGERASQVALLCAIATGVFTTGQMLSLHVGGHAIKRALPRLAVARDAPFRRTSRSSRLGTR